MGRTNSGRGAACRHGRTNCIVPVHGPAGGGRAGDAGDRSGAVPFRRAAGAALASVLIAAIAVGATVVYGAIVGGGGQSWRDAQAVIVEKESGARYVFVDDKLHLVLNYASALLIVKSGTPKTVLVSRKSIEGVPRGTPLGIADAPDSLPAAGRLSDAPWTICSMLRAEGNQTAPRSALLVGGGRPVARRSARRGAGPAPGRQSVPGLAQPPASDPGPDAGARRAHLGQRTTGRDGAGPAERAARRGRPGPHPDRRRGKELGKGAGRRHR